MADVPHVIEDLEIDLLLEGVFRRFGFDFRGYRREPLRMKLHALMAEEGLRTVSGLQERVMHDAAACETLLMALGSHAAALFDDPAHYRSMREALVPWLRSSPSPRIWVAECVAAEEVCSLAILLEEEDLLDRTQIYATSANGALLRAASEGRFPAECLPAYEENYRRSGGTHEFRRYVDTADGYGVFARNLRDNITWAQYNLATDASFNEFQLIACRGALAEFGTALRHRVLQLFHDSMPVYGLLSVDGELGSETAPFARCYRAINHCQGLYRRVA